MVDPDRVGEVARRVLPGLVGDDDDLRHALGGDLARDVLRTERAVERLAAGHRDRVVVEDLVGDVDARGDRGADREQPRVVVGAVAQVREDVLLARERRLADPRHAFAAHVRELGRRPVHPDRHHVAADAGGRAAAFRHARRRVVRAARAEVGRARDADARLRERGFLLVDELDALRDALAVGVVRVEAEELDALRDHARDHRGRELARGGQQPVAVRAHPFALLVELADDARAHVVAPVVELLLQLVLDDLPLLLDDEDLLEALGELAHALRLERPGHRDLVDADAQLRHVALVEAEVVERLAHVEVALARRDDAEPRLRAVDDDPVEPVDARVVQRRVDLVVLHPRLGDEERIGPADRDAVGRQREVVGDDDVDAVRVDRHRGRALDRVRDALEADPQARVAAHRPAVQAQVEDLLHGGRVEHRDHRRRELVVRLVRQRRGLRRVVVAGEREHAAVLRRAGEVRVLEHVAAAVDARALAVPHRVDAVDGGARVQVDLLRAPDRRRREILVQARLEPDVRALEELLRAPQRLVEAAQRASAIAGDEAAGVEPRELVALLLQDQQADDRLRAGEIHAAGVERVLVVEGDVRERDAGAGWGHQGLRKIVFWGCSGTWDGVPSTLAHARLVARGEWPRMIRPRRPRVHEATRARAPTPLAMGSRREGGSDTRGVRRRRPFSRSRQPRCQRTRTTYSSSP